jgi:hypothetical protein
VTSRSLPHHSNLPAHLSGVPMMYSAASATSAASNMSAAQAALLAGFGSYPGHESFAAFALAAAAGSNSAPLAEISEFSSVAAQPSAMHSPPDQAAPSQHLSSASRQAHPVSLGAFGDTLEPLEAEDWSG